MCKLRWSAAVSPLVGLQADMAGQNGLKLSQEGTTVGVLGGGAWGTALAFHCVRKGHDTMLWAREKEVVEGINGPDQENSIFLKVYFLPQIAWDAS